jgi:hypothetical protein
MCQYLLFWFTFNWKRRLPDGQINPDVGQSLAEKIFLFVIRCPAFPAPADFEGQRNEKTPGASRRENNCCCHRPRRRTIQHPRDFHDRIDKPRRTGCPAFAGHDSFALSTVIPGSMLRIAPE